MKNTGCAEVGTLVTKVGVTYTGPTPKVGEPCADFSIAVDALAGSGSVTAEVNRSYWVDLGTAFPVAYHRVMEPGDRFEAGRIYATYAYFFFDGNLSDEVVISVNGEAASEFQEPTDVDGPGAWFCTVEDPREDDLEAPWVFDKLPE